MLRQVRESLGKVVIVRGVMEYIGADIDPTSASVEEIEAVPEDFQPITTEDLFGVAPNLTSGRDTQEYIREIRSDWKH